MSGGVVFPELSKLLNQEDALAHPGYAVFLLSAGVPMLRKGVLVTLMSLYRLVHPSHHAGNG